MTRAVRIHLSSLSTLEILKSQPESTPLTLHNPSEPFYHTANVKGYPLHTPLFAHSPTQPPRPQNFTSQGLRDTSYICPASLTRPNIRKLEVQSSPKVFCLFFFSIRFPQILHHFWSIKKLSSRVKS